MALAATSQVKHADGRIRYIVDLYDDTVGKPDHFDNANSFIDWHKAKSAQLIDDVIKLRGVELFTTTSLVGTSFTAYLTEEQVEHFAKDNRVKLITADAYLEPSAPWGDQTDPSGQVRPWGLQALGVTQAGPSNGTATIYVLDYGVEFHADLNVVEQLTALTTTTNGQPVNPIGCYPHATHVAGIAGASDNTVGVVGVLPGVRIVSIALGDTNSCPGGSSGISIASLVAGLEKIYFALLLNNKVGIVNLSVNATSPTSQVFDALGTVGQKMKFVATPTYVYLQYRGALIVQSAGNYNANACAYAYNAPAENDGILIIGGLDENGQPAVPLNGFANAYLNDPLVASSQQGSNNLGCVEFWAPSQRIKSTWPTGYQLLSGTSMAAPHVSGLAARLLESNPNTTSTQLEGALRNLLITITAPVCKCRDMITFRRRRVPPWRLPRAQPVAAQPANTVSLQ